ncbi:hypothetical protein HMPREF9374_2323 [Desmospora sp. 8437]|nr:hypothetical protein HMPREF9374_2323 [Desmospora sp. 8437]
MTGKAVHHVKTGLPATDFFLSFLPTPAFTKFNHKKGPPVLRQP